MAQIPTASLLCQGTSRGFQKFSKLSLCAGGKRKFDEWGGLGLGAGVLLPGLTAEGKGPTAGGLLRAPLGQGLVKARLWVLHPEHTLLSEWLAALMLGLNQNLLTSCEH